MANQKASNSPVVAIAIVLIAIITASAISYHDYSLSIKTPIHNVSVTTRIVPANASASTTTMPYCTYGHVCLDPSAPCAQPGAIYDCPMIPVNITSNATRVAVNFSFELNDSQQAGYALNQTIFRVNSQSECSIELIAYCNNNVPTQFICVNSAHAFYVAAQYNQTHSVHQACPQYFEAGTLGCAVQGNYCVVTSTNP